MRRNILVGSRYFDDNKEIYKVVKVKNKDTYSLVSLSSGKRFTKSRKELDTEYTLLNPNGYIIVSIVESEIPGRGMQKDVIVALYRSKQEGIEATNNLPYCVCRQNIINIFYQMAQSNRMFHCGMCISLETCPKDVNYNLTIACDNVSHNIAIAVYMDDVLEDVLKLFKHDVYDTVLKAGTINNIGNTTGYVGTLNELLIQEDFSYDFHRAFGINEVDFEIEYDKETFLLDSLQIEYFENEYSYEMFDAYAIPFDFTIRLKDIQKDYFMVYSKPEKKVYIIVYTKGLFYDKNIDDSIKNIRNQSSIIRKNMSK